MWIATGKSGFDTVVVNRCPFIWSEMERRVSPCRKHYIQYIGLTIGMGGDGVSDISTRAGEGVGGVVNGAGLTSGSIARL